MIGQVISVLLTNALSYTPSGGQITVQTREADSSSQSRVCIWVHDSGPGIPADEYERIFTRFFRGKVGRESGIQGTGLGLAMAHRIVERHKGRIEVYSGDAGGRWNGI
ncbi:MAG: ATP-binding protein [Anaerolineae bacterium]|nr:ATP-binding protein [Anaerolineae bacterium]